MIPLFKPSSAGTLPADVAKELIAGTKIGDVDFRKALVKGGENAVAESTDPLIVLARKLDPEARERRQWTETHLTSVQSAAVEKIGKARLRFTEKILIRMRPSRSDCRMER